MQPVLLLAPQFSSVQSCLTLCDPMDCSTPGLPVHQQLLELAQTHVHLILCRPLLLLPSIFASIRVFSNESVLRIRRPKILTNCSSHCEEGSRESKQLTSLPSKANVLSASKLLEIKSNFLIF